MSWTLHQALRPHAFPLDLSLICLQLEITQLFESSRVEDESKASLWLRRAVGWAAGAHVLGRDEEF